MTTIIQAVKKANLDAGIRNFSYARIDEFSAFMESFKELDYPRNIIVPIETRGTWAKAGQYNRIAVIQGWMLTRIKSDTSELRTAAAEEVYIEPMRQLAKAFLSNLTECDIVDPEEENISDTIKPEYAFLSSGLFGVSYSMNLPVTEGMGVC